MNVERPGISRGILHRVIFGFTLLCALGWLNGCQSTEILRVADFSSAEQLPNHITLVSWNAQKGSDVRFRADMAHLLVQHNPDFVLMQEATEDLLIHQGIGGHFAGSWRYPFPKGPTIGLMTLSKVPPGQLMPLPTRHREFFVTAPKLSLATQYPLPDGRNLLLINVHILAFERGRNKAVAEQLQGLKVVMLAHEGPIILAGDFNTWNRQRLGMLEQLASELGLTEVVGFPDGRRTGGTGYRWADKVYGISWDLPLDRIYYRGFSAYSAEILPYDSSDHAALLVKLALHSEPVAKIEMPRS